MITTGSLTRPQSSSLFPSHPARHQGEVVRDDCGRVIQLLKSQQVSHLAGSKSKQNQLTFRVQLFRHRGRPESDLRL